MALVYDILCLSVYRCHYVFVCRCVYFVLHVNVTPNKKFICKFYSLFHVALLRFLLLSCCSSLLFFSFFQLNCCCHWVLYQPSCLFSVFLFYNFVFVCTHRQIYLFLLFILLGLLMICHDTLRRRRRWQRQRCQCISSQRMPCMRLTIMLMDFSEREYVLIVRTVVCVCCNNNINNDWRKYAMRWPKTMYGLRQHIHTYTHTLSVLE